MRLLKQFSKLKKSEIEILLAKEQFKFTDQLLDIKIYNLTKDQIEKLEKDIDDIILEIEYYESQTDKSLYLKDLSELNLKSDLASKIKIIEKKKKK